MRNDVAVSVQGLGKKYRLGELNRYHTLREAVGNLGKRAAGALRRGGRSQSRELWALKDASFEIEKGEIVGVIGKNGAGKTTLLRLLSRITEPTSGSARIHGRVGSLLEVGTGFHPELTGRENIYLNGAILGMRRGEIDASFDEIVAFSEVERFLDTPVKRYSSGMYVRLAFAVAAHLNPEILLIDEVLAVGDTGFQKKCLGKMETVAGSGRTVMFVSHNMATVEGLCGRCILLEDGRVTYSGEPRKVIQEYLGRLELAGTSGSPGEYDLSNREAKYHPAGPMIQALRTEGVDGNSRRSFRSGDPMILRIRLRGMKRFTSPVVRVKIKTVEGYLLASFDSGMTRDSLKVGDADEIWATCRLDAVPFNPGRYVIDLSLSPGRGRADFVDTAATFDIVEQDVYGTGYALDSKWGPIHLHGSWSAERK